MKIVLVARVYPTSRPGGMPYVCQDRARALVGLGYEVHVLTTGLKNGSGFTADDQGVMVHHLPCEKDVHSQEFADACVAFCGKLNPHVIHTESLDLDRPWWCSRPGNAKRIAITLHGFCWGSWFTKWNHWRLSGGEFPVIDERTGKSYLRERNCFRMADVVIGISKHEHYFLRDQLGLLDAKLVYNPISDVFFDRPIAPLPSVRKFLAAAISGHGERGFDSAADAAKSLGREIVTARKVKREEMPAVYDSVSALVLPTAYCQGADLTVSEAIACGRPVIMTGTGSYLRESEPGGIWHGSTVLVPLGDQDALQAAMGGPLPKVDPQSMSIHRPEVHANNWLEAVL